MVLNLSTFVIHLVFSGHNVNSEKSENFEMEKNEMREKSEIFENVLNRGYSYELVGYNRSCSHHHLRVATQLLWITRFGPFLGPHLGSLKF